MTVHKITLRDSTGIPAESTVDDENAERDHNLILGGGPMGAGGPGGIAQAAAWGSLTETLSSVCVIDSSVMY